MAYKFTKGTQVIGDLKAADDAQRDTLIDFGEDYIDVKVAPNPFISHISVDYKSHLEGEGILVVKDLTGQTVYEQGINVELGVQSINLDLDTYLPSGIYMLTIEIRNYIFTQKIVKGDF